MNQPKTHPEKLLDLVEEARKAKVVLPDFQRSFIWKRENIEELLVSILQGYFIGSFLFLDTPTDNSLFPFRIIEGLDKINPNVSPNNHPTLRLVLDGQQRLTSLFYVLYEPNVRLANSRYPHKFFLRLDLLQDKNPDDAVYGISLGDRRRFSEMQQLIKEGKAISFSLFRNSSQFYQWLYNNPMNTLQINEKKIVEEFYNRFNNFMIPVVSISAESGKENIVNIFERINRTGVSLSLFDLVAARLYLKNINLRNLWHNFENNNKHIARIIRPEFILKIISIWQGKEPKKTALLDVIDELEKKEFEKQWELACYWMNQAYNRISSARGYGSFNEKWIPYSTMLVPLAVLLNFISDIHGTDELFRKLDRWYWGSVFSQRYDQAVDTITFKDVREVKEWMKGNTSISWLDNFAADQLDLSGIEDRKSSIYRGVMCLIVLAGAKDFLNGQAAVLSECEDDHIFPKSRFQNKAEVNSIINRTLISPSSNRIKGSKLPSQYLSHFLESHEGDNDRMMKTLNSHLINEEAKKAMEFDNFEAFIASRKTSIINEISKRIKGLI